MKRRDVLKRAAGIGFAGLIAGCTSQRQAPGGNGEETDTTTTETTTTEPPISVQSRKVVESNGTCGQDNEASVTFEGSKVVITGSIPTNNPCHRAEIADSSFDTASNELKVTMSTVETDADVCQQCLGKVVYRAEIGFNRGNAKSVSVSHSSMSGTSEVATAENAQ